MKTIPILPFLGWLAAATTTAAAIIDRTAWQWQQSLDIATQGISRLDLPPATLDSSQPSLADLRLIAPDGVETPWLLEKAGPVQVNDLATTSFRATLEGRTTELTASHSAAEIDGITLESPAPAFLKSIRIEGSNDGATWQPIAAGEVVFRQAGGAERVRVPIPPAKWQNLRISIDDDRSPPVAFTGLRVSPAAARAETLDQPITLEGREEVAGETRLTLGLGAKNLYLAELRIDVPEGVFSRSCQATVSLTDKNGTTTQRQIGSATIYRVLGESGTAAAGLVIPLHQRVTVDRLLLTIRNGDSPPLDVRAVAATRYPDRLVFFANQAGAWTLLTGNRRTEAPNYDLAPLRARLARTPGTCLSPGPLVPKPDYKAPPTLPDVSPAGSQIDLKDWAYRRTVHATLPGVVKIELDAVTLAHMERGDLGDLRLVQNDKQIPWLVEPSPPVRALQPQVADDPDPKRPALSRWKLTLPVSGLPAHLLTARSPDLLFTRQLRVLSQGKDELGNPWTRVIGSTTWTKSPGTGSAAHDLQIPLDGARVPNTLWLETENGDNPPIRLEAVEIRHQAPSLVAKISAPETVFLYYGNPRVLAPAYDIGLVRAELLAADKQTATLGDEEILDPGKRRSEAETSAGSPWLWGALGLVVVVLLAVVAKLLPKEKAQ